jgi:hypothetical protein
MKKPYTQSVGLTQRLRKLGLTALLAGGATVAAHAQTLNYSVAGATNVTTTYTDLGTSGTAIATTSTDDANSTVQNIGFTFNYNGSAFTQFYLNTNGFIKLGATAPSVVDLFPAESATSTATELFQSTADPNIIAPFNIDLTAGSVSGTEYRVATTGTAGSRICTIQWKNVSDKAAVKQTQYANTSFQVRLYEGTGVIEFVYGTATASANTDDFRSAEIGLKGSDFANGQIVQALKSSSTAWSGATFADFAYVAANQALITNNFRKTVLPDAGRTYRFTPTAANDAAVSAIYTLGKLPKSALPHTIQAVVSNPGSSAQTNLVVTLNVTGANTFTNTQTIASLAAGGTTTVTFSALPTTLVAGVNTVAVSVPADGNSANNSATVQQTVNSGTAFSYVPTNLTNTPSSTLSGLGAVTPANGLIFAARYTTLAAGTVTAVSAYIQDVNTVGKTLYGVVLSPAGAILAQSANYVVQASDINTYHTFAITTPPAVAANGSFLAGMAQAGQSATIYPMGTQTEAPGRPSTFYITGLTGGTLTDVNATANYRFMIEASVSTALATSPELMRAVTVYPNPSASGVFNLAINGANAQKGLEVEVVNTLGQRVYAGTARDNFTTTLDLSNLANGLYHLKIKNGDEYMQRQLSVVK